MTNLTRPDATTGDDKPDAMLNGKLLIRLDLGPVSHEIDLPELETKLPALLHGIGELRKQLWPEAKCQMEFDESDSSPWTRHLVIQQLNKAFDAQMSGADSQYCSMVDLRGGLDACCASKSAASSAESSLATASNSL